MQTYYLHHAGGLPCVPRNLRPSASNTESVVTPLRFASSGTTIEEFARNAIDDLVARGTPRATGLRVLYGHSMGGLVAHEICRQLASNLPSFIDVVVLAAAAPWWIPGLLCPRAALISKGVPNSRLETQLAAIDRYEPKSKIQPEIPVRILYAKDDPIVPPRAVMKWATFSWPDIRFHNIGSASHLFHTETADESFVLRWQALSEGFGLATNEERRHPQR
jgi:surfactin synthase thioesterase subunit